MKRARKAISILVTLAMLMGLLLPAGSAFAYSENRVSKVVNVASDYVGAPGKLTIKEDADYPADFEAGDSFMVTLPSGVNWDPAFLSVTLTNAANPAGIDLIATNRAVASNDQTLDITFPATVDPTGVDTITIDLGIEIDGAEGDIKVKVEPMDSGVSPGEYLIARVIGGDTVTKAMDVKTVGDGAVTGGVIRIEETAVGSLGAGQETVTLKLPSNFEWSGMNVATDVTFSGGFLGRNATLVNGTGDGFRTLQFTFTPLANPTQRGIINITPKFKATKDAKYGEVTVNVSGTDVADADVVVANYSDYGVKIKVDSVKELVAGKFDQDTDKITIEESVPGTIMANRDITLELPSWVKVTGIQSSNLSNGGAGNILSFDAVDGDDSEIVFSLSQTTSTTKAKIEFKLDLSIEGNKSGDIEAKIFSKNAGVTETKLVVAKAVGLIEAQAVEKEIKIGVQSQETNDIIITELKKENFKDTTGKKQVTVTLPEGVKFAVDPKVEVIEGNMEIDKDSIDVVTNVSIDDRLVFNVKSSSSKASKIKISNIKLTVDRTVPEGYVVAKIGGASLIENSKSATGWLNDTAAGGGPNTLDAGEFDTSTAAKVNLAKVVTPAPESGTVLFNIGSTVYSVGGITKVMDAAPYIKEGRTYVPVRYLALALGVSEDKIAFENGVVTLTKGADVLQLTIGSKSLVKGNATVEMDVAPEVVNGRTMLPARYVAEGFGGVVGFFNGQVVISLQ